MLTLSSSYLPIDERHGLVFMARTAETAERYEDMCKIMRELVQATGKDQQVSIRDMHMI